MGNNGSLPWPYDKEDLRNFKEATIGDIVVMGSNTWSDPMMPKPLPNRTCIVVTNQHINNFSQAHEIIAGKWLTESLQYLRDHNPKKTIWIIGGAKLLVSCKPFIEEIHHTMFMTEYNCDVKLDLVEYLSSFNKVSEGWGRNKTFTTWIK